MGFYDISIKDPSGESVSMADFRDKVVVVVNTATGCGFTPHYEPLQAMYERHHDAGLEIIDVPCNQFNGQTPGDDEQIAEFCSLNYGTTFPRMAKTDVNGEDACELFVYLKGKKGFEGFGEGEMAERMAALLASIDPDYENNPEIKWNFTKFVIDRSGEVVARFEPTADMAEVEACVEKLL